MMDESSDTSDEGLDATSERFDPLKALYSSKMQLPSSNAPIYDNVTKFESVMRGINSKPSKTVKPESLDEFSERRFLPHQAPVTRARPEKNALSKNVLSKMQNTLGPLQMLHQCMENRLRVRVYTRNARGIRGHVEAYVAAFDKFWNLALEDCFEIWCRKVKRKAPALGAHAVKAEGEEEGAAAAGAGVPKTVVRMMDGKTETLERHVPQMLLRGEQVAIIVKIN